MRAGPYSNPTAISFVYPIANIELTYNLLWSLLVMRYLCFSLLMAQGK